MPRTEGRPWRPEEDEWLRGAWAAREPGERLYAFGRRAAASLGRPPGSVIYRVQYIGLHVPDSILRARAERTPPPPGPRRYARLRVPPGLAVDPFLADLVAALGQVGVTVEDLGGGECRLTNTAVPPGRA